MFSCAGGAFDGSAGAAVGAAVACGSCAGGAVAFGSLVAYQACGVFGLTWFRLACGANLWGWLPCVDWVVGVLGTHFSAYNPTSPGLLIFLGPPPQRNSPLGTISSVCGVAAELPHGFRRG